MHILHNSILQARCESPRLRAWAGSSTAHCRAAWRQDLGGIGRAGPRDRFQFYVEKNADQVGAEESQLIVNARRFQAM